MSHSLKATNFPIHIDIEAKEGSICGYITETTRDAQLSNYMEEQGFTLVTPLIQEKFQKIAILKSVYVEEGFRGRGIGSKLLTGFIEKASENDVEAIILVADTAEGNEFDLVNWYEVHGFQVFFGYRDLFPIMVLTEVAYSKQSNF